MPNSSLKLAALLLLAPIFAAAESTTLLLTANTAPIYPALTDKPPVENPSADFEKALLDLKASNPQASLVEVGNMLSISYTYESAYSHPGVAFRTKAGFAVTNLSAKDAAIGTVGGIGLQIGGEELRSKTISGLETMQGTPFPVTTDVNGKGIPTTFVSYSDPTTITSLAGKLAELKQTDPADAVRKAREAKRLVVGLGDALPKALPKEAAPDVYVALRQEGSPESGAVTELPGSHWAIQAPRTGEILKVELSRDDKGVLAQPKVERVEYLKADQVAALTKYPTPRIGYPIPNANDVVNSFFGEPVSVRVDKIPVNPRLPESDLDEIAVYHVTLPDEGLLRLYRVHSMMPSWGHAKDTASSGFPDIDMVVAVNAKHELRRVLNRTKFPVAMAPTTLLEAMNSLVGKDPATWAPDPQTIAGAEEVFAWLATDVRQTLELDRKLYGPGGLMTNEATGKPKSASKPKAK